MGFGGRGGCLVSAHPVRSGHFVVYYDFSFGRVLRGHPQERAPCPRASRSWWTSVVYFDFSFGRVSHGLPLGHVPCPRTSRSWKTSVVYFDFSFGRVLRGLPREPAPCLHASHSWKTSVVYDFSSFGRVLRGRPQEHVPSPRASRSWWTSVRARSSSWMSCCGSSAVGWMEPVIGRRRRRRNAWPWPASICSVYRYKTMFNYTVEPLLRGHPDHRPPPLERPLANVNLNTIVSICTPDERPSLLKGHCTLPCLIKQ